jgi:hypothetical protein
MQSKDYEFIIHQTFVQNGQLWIHYSLLNQEEQGVHNQFMPLSDLTEGLNYALYQSKFAILKGSSVPVDQTEEIKQSLSEPNESELSTNQLKPSMEPHEAVETSVEKSSPTEFSPLPDPSHIHDFVLKEPHEVDAIKEKTKSAAVIPTDPMVNTTASSQNSEVAEVSDEAPTIEPTAESDLLPEVTDEEATAVELTNKEVNQKNITNADTLFDAMAAAENNE